jgi:3-hydroxybutyryl-CoA dehydrogenase
LLVSTIALIGAGTVGARIAHRAAVSGYHVILEDILPAALRRAGSEMRSQLDKSVELGALSEDEAKTAMDRLEYAESVADAAREADFVIEAVPDEMESKSEIFILLDKICRPATILASSTSLLSITEIASVTYRVQKCIGARFSSSGSGLKLVEIVRAAETDDDTLATTVEIGRRMFGEVMVVRDPVEHWPASVVG